jgi:hypothetical protein
MTSLVSDFIINPVLRQARRFSEISRATLTAESESNSPESRPPDGGSEAPEGQEGPDIRPGASTSRPLSSSTQSTSVEQTQTNAIDDSEDIFPITVPMPVGKDGVLPEDDGMGALRRRLLAIQSKEIPAEDKARLMHETLMESYRRSRAASIANTSSSAALPAGEAWEQSIALGTLDSLKFWQHPLGEAPPAEKFTLTAQDIKPTYASLRLLPQEQDSDQYGSISRPLGCQHYLRNVKLQCSTCHKWHTCRFCHDEAESHTLIRKETKNMLCMLCSCPQRAADVCVNCGITAARYYCNICKLWDDHPSKSIYHCDDCGICRRGEGLGKDFFHCKVNLYYVIFLNLSPLRCLPYVY